MSRALPLALFCWFIGLLTIEANPDAVLGEMEKIQAEEGTRTASIGLCFLPLDGEPDDALGFHIDLGLIPASTLKAVTTATALEVLGPDFTFTTRLELAGSLGDDGVLSGDLVIRGGGDPTLGRSNISSTFSRWQSALRKAGVRSIEGSIVGDATLFGTQMVPDTWQWNDMGNYYAAGACGLTFHQNLFYCRFRTPSVGGPAPFTGTDPRLPEIRFINEMRVGSSGSGDRGFVYGAPYGTVYHLRGTVPAGTGSFTIKGALPDPAFFCARAFTQHLNENGIEIAGVPTTIRRLRIEDRTVATRKEIHAEESEPLRSIAFETNMKSNNLQAESVHRMIGVTLADEGTTKASSDAVKEFWSEKGVDMRGFHMGDGCGLARANTITPRQMAMILYYAAKGEHFDSFYDSLPVAGRSGTLRSIGGGSAAEGRIVAKSGTIDRVRNYSGYVNARSGKRYAFALFMNNYSGESWEVKSQIVRVWNRMVSL